MSEYNNINGDGRDVLERYLPTAYKTESTATSSTYKAILHAIKRTVKTTESDLLENVSNIFLNNAKGPFLDLYGSWVGITRKSDESDELYRVRVIDEITRGRVTISNIVSGIKNELGEDTSVSIYETWRNIFILNQSLLNGPDYLMGTYYRYAVIDITLNKYVPENLLYALIDKYKASGVMVLFTYADSIVAADGSLLSLSTSLSAYLSSVENKTLDEIDTTNEDFYLNGLPVQDKDLNYPFFKTNQSSLNGNDLLAGTPRQLFSDEYIGVPSLNIMGNIADGLDPRSYLSPYDYIYKLTKIEVANENLLVGTNKNVNSSVNSSDGTYTTDYEPITEGYKFSFTYTKPSTGWSVYLFNGVKKEKLTPSTEYTLSFKANVSTDISMFVMLATGSSEYNLINPVTPAEVISSKGDQLVTLSIRTIESFPPESNQQLYINGFVNKVGTFKIWDLKLEKGSQATKWIAAPEDNNPNTYKHPYSIDDYYSVSNQGLSFGNSEQLYPNFAFDISDAVISRMKYTFEAEDYQKEVDSLDLKIGPSPYGLRSSKITINNTSQLGSWSVYSQNSDIISDPTSSVGIYRYTLSSSTTIKSVSLKDYYPTDGAYRRLYLNKKGSNPLLLARTKSQTFSDINMSSYIIDKYRYLVPYIRKITLGNSVMTNPEVFNYELGSWVPITSNNFDLSSYIYVSGDNPIYLLIRDRTVNAQVSFSSLNIELENQAKVTKYQVDTSAIDDSEYSINKNKAYSVEKDSPVDAFNHSL